MKKQVLIAIVASFAISFLLNGVSWIFSPKVERIKALYETSLYPELVPEISGYSVEGNQFQPTDVDPQILFHPQNLSFNTIRILFSSPLEQATDVEIYYDISGDGLSEDHKLSAELPQGTDSFSIGLPFEQYQTLRVDINGSFSLEGLFAVNQVSILSRPRFRLDGLISMWVICSVLAIPILFVMARKGRGD